MEIRLEQNTDREAIRRINIAAFGTGLEAELVAKLRGSCSNYLSFVAVENGTVVGHILFTPVTLDGSELTGMGLAPMAVLPEYQKHGIGSRLVRHGLEYLRKSGCPFVIVLGHPTYYPRFDFERASKYQLKCQWDGVPDEAFMVLMFDKDALPSDGGVVRYRQEFDEAM